MSELSEKQDELVELRLRIAELERSLEESLSRTSSMVEAFDGLVYICSKNYEVEFANERLIERTGYNPVGQKCYKALHDLDKICPWCVNDRVFKGEMVRWEVQSPKDNNWYYIVNTPVYHTDGSVSKMAMIQDITERKRAEEELLKLRLGIERSNEAIFITDINGTIVYVNPAFEKIYGYSKEEALGKTPRILKSGVLSQEVYKQFWDTLIAKKIVTGELINKTKDERLLNIEGSANPILDKDGNIAGFLAIQRDITERKRAEELRFENIRLENERLIYANKIKSEFLSIMSHELRTPLTSVIGYSILLKEEADDKFNVRQKFYIDNIITSSKHLLDLINSILDLTKIEAGKMELVVESVSVPETINEILDLLKEKAREKRIVLKKEFDPELPFIKADMKKFKQILFNLVGNAVKFSKRAGGTVTVTTKKEDNMAKFSVSDTGIGIKEKDIPRLFHEFEQLDKGLSRKYGGTGLGLAITKLLVEMQGGKIMVESTYGKGSTFSFLLPL